MNLWDELSVFDGGSGDPDFDPMYGNPYSHATLFNTFFSDVIDTSLTENMYDMASPGDSSYWPRKVARDMVASYLNATHAGVNYPYTTTQITSWWYSALTDFQGGDDSALRSLHTTLDDANNLGCEF